MFLLVNECIKYSIALVRGSEHSNFCQLLNLLNIGDSSINKVVFRSCPNILVINYMFDNDTNRTYKI